MWASLNIEQSITPKMRETIRMVEWTGFAWTNFPILSSNVKIIKAVLLLNLNSQSDRKTIIEIGVSSFGPLRREKRPFFAWDLLLFLSLSQDGCHARKPCFTAEYLVRSNSWLLLVHLSLVLACDTAARPQPKGRTKLNWSRTSQIQTSSAFALRQIKQDKEMVASHPNH